MSDPTNEILQKIKSNTNSRAHKSLDLVNDICKEQVERGSTDLRVVTIGKLSEARGGPSTQAIRNASGSNYRALIEAWDESVSKQEPRHSNSKSGTNSWIDSIEKPHIRILAQDAVNKAKRLQSELDHLKSITKVTIDMRKNSGTYGTVEINGNSVSAHLSELELKALSQAISDENVERQGWTMDDQGQILDSKRRQVFKPGFTNAIKKIIASKPQ